MAMIWSESILLTFIRAVIMKIPRIWKHADMIITIFYLAFFLLSILEAAKELYVNEIALAFLFYMIFGIHYVLFPLNAIYYEESAIQVMSRNFPMFLVGICTFRIRREETLKILYFISLLTIFVYGGYMLIIGNANSDAMKVGDMHTAYMLLPHLCFVFSAVLKKANPCNIVAFALGSLLLLFLGNRGSLLCLGVYVIFSILLSGRLKHPILFLVFATAFMLSLFSFGLLDYLYNLAEKYGFSVRIFQKLENGEITTSTGRDRIYARVMEQIKMHPLLGLGIFSDQRVAGGLYAHNILLEFMINYGVVIGVGLLVVVLRLFVNGFLYLRKTKQFEALDFYTSVFFSCCFKLILSNSYLLEPYFFFAMGFAYAAVGERNRLRRKPEMKRGLKQISERGDTCEQ